MLGAELQGLAALSQQLTTTTGEIGACQQGSTSTTSTVVQTVSDASQQALTRIQAELDKLRVAVEAANTQAESTVWTGANRETFVAGYHQFRASMSTAEATTQETFEQFRASIDQMAASLSDYVTQFSGALSSAQESTTSMASAVTAQQANLDAAMNTGMSIG